MIEFIIIAGLIAAIVYAAMNWPDIEARIFPGQARKHDAVRPTEPAEPANPEPAVAEETIAKGFMKKKEITTEPEVEPEDFHKTQGKNAAPAEAEVEADKPTEETPETPSDNSRSEEAVDAEDEISAPNPAADYAANPTSSESAETPEAEAEKVEPVKPEPTKSGSQSAPKSETPGGHVTGAPARPSQPAYVNASSGVEERVEDLAAEADAAYRDRDYEKAEQACLKILMREPKNHKYMTRIGQIYQEMGQLEDAKEAFETAKKLDPKNFFVLNRLAEVERLLNDRGGRTSENKRKSGKDED